ncbi:heme o synthase [Teredinibacter turnerae]|uniref:heme o synthase n=1 Tax=Teredinibacter turnerae TaxID=2426 RepID=UPI0003AA8C41|nr:heme o synthase [Teredinibacter turnerae]
MALIIRSEIDKATQAITTALPWRDYYELTKPKVVMLMLLTSLIGMLLATPSPAPLWLLVLGNLGIGLCAGAAAAVNHLVDRHVDVKMARTFHRPIANGRIAPANALLFSALLGGAGLWILSSFINALTAWLTLASLLGYAVIYTLFLKRATPQNIVIGGLAGAAPPLLGWTAVTGELDGHGLLLVLIIFAWTPPHFWALALYRKKEYAKAGIPMLPVTHGDSYTRLHILLYTVILIAVTLLPFATRMMGYCYLLGALVLGAGFLYRALKLLVSKDPKQGLETFKFSIIYLMALFIVMLVDHYLFPIPVYGA